MKKVFPLFLLLLSAILASHPAGYDVVSVDLLQTRNLEINGFGPLLVASDSHHDRIVLVHTGSSALSVIDGRTHGVANIALSGRIPQYVKDEALLVAESLDLVLVVGDHALHAVYPGRGRSQSFTTAEQYDMVALDERNLLAWVVGRASAYIVRIDLRSEEMTRIRWAEDLGEMANLNQTPPPPIRKVVWDRKSGMIAAIDGGRSQLVFFTPAGKKRRQRRLNVRGGERWHFAGVDAGRQSCVVVIETAAREVVEACKIDLRGRRDVTVPLPGLREGVGVTFSPSRNEAYIPYDNDPVVHCVDFTTRSVHAVPVPSYGNDATALDAAGQRLYVASWAWSEVEIIDLTQRYPIGRLRDVGVIPHMFSMTFHPQNGKLYVPLGASAVNGSFGAALTAVEPDSGKLEKIRTGWAPVGMVAIKEKDVVWVFNNEDEFAEVTPGGEVRTHRLPVNYPGPVLRGPDGLVTLAYGPHQSYWPVVYIWGAENGVLTIDPQTLQMNSRRIPRQAQDMVFDKRGALYALQNNWGREKQFLICLPDDIRSPNLPDMRVELPATVVRETTQRLLEYDRDPDWLYIARVGEKDDQAGTLQIIALPDHDQLLTFPVGQTPTDIAFDDERIYVTSFDSNQMAAVQKRDFSVVKTATGDGPVAVEICSGEVYVLCQQQNTLEVPARKERFPIPFKGFPAQMAAVNDTLIITTHSAAELRILSFSPATMEFSVVHRERYPFAATTLDTNNSSFYLRGQYADGIFALNQILTDHSQRIWISDLLSGRVLVLTPRN